MSDKRAQVYAAIDTPDKGRAADMAEQLSGRVDGLKIGMEFFYAHNSVGYAMLAQSGLPIFLDLKLHDIPNTVAQAVRALAPLEPTLLNVHAGGGAAMMQAAADAAGDANDNGLRAPTMLAVTILTSLAEADLHDMGISGTPRDQVLRLAALARANGMGGVVCSAHEIDALRAEMGSDFKLIVPGIRPSGSAAHDQKRVMSPEAAQAAGADILVIGRAISAADDMAASADAIKASLQHSLAEAD
ncbi:MAG: orotidine-5'-phosphate decarboxylase [Alphaproteobacteria bacterium]|nr:orotidine-5'-phosphate decarboxylase [Alphaproteobacteria bacterium]